MPKNKKGKRGGKASTPKQRSGPSWAKSFVRETGDDDGNDDRTQFRGFSLRDEGSRTNRSSLNPNVKLRNQGIAFVSAGTPEPVMQDEDREEEKSAVAQGQEANMVDATGDTDLDFSEGAIAQMNIQSSAELTGQETDDTGSDVDVIGVDNEDHATSTFQAPPTSSTPHAASKHADITPPEEPALFFVDVTGDANVSFKGNRPLVREPSPARSDSSEEVVVFHGRKGARTITDPPQKRNPPPHLRAVAEAHARSSPAANVSKAPVQALDNPPQITDALLAALEPSNPKRTPLATSATVALTNPSQEPPRMSLGSKATGWAAKPSSFGPVQEDSGFEPAPSGSRWRTNDKAQRNDPRPASELPNDEWEDVESADEEDEKALINFKQSSAAATDAEVTSRQLRQGWKSRLQEKKSPRKVQTTGQPEDQRGVFGVAGQHPVQEDEDDNDGIDTALDEILLSSKGRKGRKGRKRQNRRLAHAAAESNEEAAYDDYMQNLLAQAEDEDDEERGIGNQIVGREMPSHIGGPSLVVDDLIVGEDELLNPHLQVLHEDSTDSTEPIGQDFEDVYSSSDSNDHASDHESSDLEDELNYNEREQWEDEADLRQRRIDAMSDEQIARLYAKQQEFGYGGEELIIDDGTYVSASEGVGDVNAAKAGLAELDSVLKRTPNKRNVGRRSGKRGGPSFPDATLMADVLEQDQYGGFDVMDYDRPSLRPKTKGRKGKLPPELEALSDDELKDNMRSQWDNDRQKKSAKKAEREELRKQGMLGASGRKGQANLSMKYLEGMTMLQVKSEIREFVTSVHEERAFPPMAKEDRKALHEICTVLGLKSKSMGGGKKRFPIVYKTSRTPAYDDETFNNTMFQASRGFLKNSAYKGKANKFKDGPGRARASKGGGFGPSATSYRDGDVVGSGAAELGEDNFGHKLMQKMGWSKGMALGKDGEGRLVPVAHVVKMGKGGLG